MTPPLRTWSTLTVSIVCACAKENDSAPVSSADASPALRAQCPTAQPPCPPRDHRLDRDHTPERVESTGCRGGAQAPRGLIHGWPAAASAGGNRGPRPSVY